MCNFLRLGDFKRILMPGLILTVGLALLLSACSSQPSIIVKALGQEVVLAPGETVSISKEGLTIRFVEVVNDSRCPTGVTCVWAGQVSSLIEITYKDATNSMTLTHLDSEKASSSFTDYVFTSEIQPYPQAGKRIAQQDYRLKLTVNKAAGSEKATP